MMDVQGFAYSGSMRVKMLYFGVLREMLGVADEAMEVADGADVGELLHILRLRTSNQAMTGKREIALEERLWRSLAVAVNREYSSLTAVLRDGDEVALLPPVSGGSCAEDERLAPLAETLKPGRLR
jgi:molybdopterin converting factor small subunit